jgi:hypothetical protein
LEIKVCKSVKLASIVFGKTGVCARPESAITKKQADKIYVRSFISMIPFITKVCVSFLIKSENRFKGSITTP